MPLKKDLLQQFNTALKNDDLDEVVVLLERTFQIVRCDSLSLHDELEALKLKILKGDRGRKINRKAEEIFHSLLDRILFNWEKAWQMVIAIAIFMFYPLLPIVISIASERDLPDSDLVLTIALFCTSVAISFNRLGLMAIGFAVALIPTYIYSVRDISENSLKYAVGIGIFSGIILLIYRLKIHVIDQEKVFKN